MKLRVGLRFLAAAGLSFGTPIGVLTAQQAAPAPAAAAAQCNPAEFAFMKQRLQDWAGLDRYRKDNDALASTSATDTSRVVFYGDSITDAWGRLEDTSTFFPRKPYVNRGIGGQTTPQMLVRFEQDVANLHPAAVVILAGTNDVAGNTGPSTPKMIEDNYTAMTQLATANGIKVVLASITPADHYGWKPSVKPVDEIRELNAWMKQFCATGACTYLDYYSAMSDAQGAMLPGYSKDGVHPTSKGYAVMAPLAEQAITKALGK